MKRARILCALGVLVLAAAVSAAGAGASTYKCTNLVSLQRQCLEANGSGLQVDSVFGEFWIYGGLAGNQVQGKLKQALRAVRPNGNTEWFWSPQTPVSCSAAAAYQVLCWRYRFVSAAGRYPDGTELCTATYKEGGGSRTRISGWACGEVQG